MLLILGVESWQLTETAGVPAGVGQAHVHSVKSSDSVCYSPIEYFLCSF